MNGFSSRRGSRRGPASVAVLRVATCGLGVALACLPPGGARAQVPAEPVLQGEVLRGSEPFPDVMVVLHRVTPAVAGEVDSVRVGADGQFRFNLPSVPAAGARSEVYFASVRHHGVLYFGALLGEAIQLDSIYRIQVYDTASPPAGGLEFTVEVRNIVLEAAEDGSWQVTDLIQIRNDGDRTWVVSGDRPVWSFPLPEGAFRFEVGQSDLPDDAVRFEGGSLNLFAPVPPGERLYVIRYGLPTPLTTVPMPGVTERIQLLVREPAPPLAVEGLVAEQPVELEPGSTYRVYSGEDLQGGQAVITEGSDGRGGVPMEWIAVILALVLGGAGVLAVGLRRGGGEGSGPKGAGGPGPVGATGAADTRGSSHAGGGAGPRLPGASGVGSAADPDSRAAILAEIARLDDEFEAGPGTDEDRRAWEARRTLLKDRLRSRK